MLRSLLLEPHVRAEALQAEQRLRFVSQRATELAAAAGLSAFGIPAMAVLAAASGLVAALSRGGAEIKGRTAQDPPSEDYEVRTTLRRRKFEPGAILAPEEPRVAAGVQDARELAFSATGFGEALVESDATERAFLRAFERAAGAVDARREEFVRDRLLETLEFQSRADVALRAVAAEARTLAQSLSSGAVARDLPAMDVPSGTIDEI